LKSDVAVWLFDTHLWGWNVSAHHLDSNTRNISMVWSSVVVVARPPRMREGSPMADAARPPHGVLWPSSGAYIPFCGVH
jgi:hypothetical protein